MLLGPEYCAEEDGAASTTDEGGAGSGTGGGGGTGTGGGGGAGNAGGGGGGDDYQVDTFVDRLLIKKLSALVQVSSDAPPDLPRT
jgi:hypothetical protein